MLLLCRLFWAVPSPPDVAIPVTMVFAPPDGSDVQTIDLVPATIPAGLHEESAALAVPRPTMIEARIAPRVMPAIPRARPSAATPVRPERASPLTGLPAKPGMQQPMVDAAELAGFAGQVQRAVQAAAVYPPVARRMNLQGRVQVSFDYEGGMVSGILVARASQSSMLDRAAQAAVRTAVYPRPPGPVARRLPLMVWVDFSLRPDG